MKRLRDSMISDMKWGLPNTLEDKLRKSAQERLCPRDVAFNESIDGSGYVTAVDIPLQDAPARAIAQ